MQHSADDYRRIFRQFNQYLTTLRQFNETMAAVGVTTFNVDPLANFAEVIVAYELQGAIQRATNEGFDVVCPQGQRIQVKSLRISTAKPGDNWLNWYGVTRKGAKAEAPLILADQLAIIVFLDSIPYALIQTPVVMREKFPVVNVKDLCYRHVEKLLAIPPAELTEITARRLHWNLASEAE